VHTESVDPRDAEWESRTPVYRVYFWHRQAPFRDISAEDMGWECDEYRLTGASDVHEVIAWAGERLPDGDRYELYLEQSDAGRLGIVRLAGIDPTDNTGDGSDGHARGRPI
jgi:hypothetical protein